MEKAVTSMALALGAGSSWRTKEPGVCPGVHFHQQIGCCAEKDYYGQDQQPAPVGAYSGGIHCSAPPFRPGMAEQQPVPVPPSRMALPSMI